MVFQSGTVPPTGGGSGQHIHQFTYTVGKRIVIKGCACGLAYKITCAGDAGPWSARWEEIGKPLHDNNLT